MFCLFWVAPLAKYVLFWNYFGISRFEIPRKKMKKLLWSCNDVHMTPKLVISHCVQKWQLLHLKIMQNYCFFFVKKSKYSIWRSCCHRYLMVFHQCQSLHNKQNNTWLLGEMKSLFSCLTQLSVSLVPCPHSKDIELHTQREISELHALIYHFLLSFQILKIKNPPQLVH